MEIYEVKSQLTEKQIKQLKRIPNCEVWECEDGTFTVKAPLGPDSDQVGDFLRLIEVDFV